MDYAEVPASMVVILVTVRVLVAVDMVKSLGGRDILCVVHERKPPRRSVVAL